MSRIGKRIVKIPSGVQLSVVNRLVQVKGPKGELNVSVPLGIAVNVEGEDRKSVV